MCVCVCVCVYIVGCSFVLIFFSNHFKFIKKKWSWLSYTFIYFSSSYSKLDAYSSNVDYRDLLYKGPLGDQAKINFFWILTISFKFTLQSTIRLLRFLVWHCIKQLPVSFYSIIFCLICTFKEWNLWQLNKSYTRFCCFTISCCGRCPRKISLCCFIDKCIFVGGWHLVNHSIAIMWLYTHLQLEIPMKKLLPVVSLMLSELPFSTCWFLMADW